MPATASSSASAAGVSRAGGGEADGHPVDAPPVDARALTGVLAGAPEVAVAYLFGSAASGRARPGSDVDVAVLPRRPLDAGRRLELLADLADAAGGRRVDLVLLDEAPPALAARVVQEGTVLLVTDEQARVRHHADVLDRYFDTQPLRRALDDGLRRRLAGGGFGRR